MEDESKQEEKFNFDEYGKRCSCEYEKDRQLYEEFSILIKSILENALNKKKIKISNIEARVKSTEKFAKKASKPSDYDPRKPKYPDPLREITDLVGIRVITFFLKKISEVDKTIYEEFDVKEKIDKSSRLLQEDKFGYQSVHYIVQIKDTHTEHKQYQEFKAEIQVRTILQHAWAEIEHDIQYKSIQVIPQEIRRRFMSLAGLLEIADREFEDIYIKYDKLINDVKKLIKTGELAKVEITPDSLKEYLNKRIGSDDRIRESSYEYSARFLIELGFSNLQQVDNCIKGYNSKKISKILHYSIQGQITKFEGLLLSGMGDNYIKNHRWGQLRWFVKYRKEEIEKLKKAGIHIRDYDPKNPIDINRTNHN